MVGYEVSLTMQFVVTQNLTLNSRPKSHLNSKVNMFWVQYSMLFDTQQFRSQVRTQFKVSISLKIDFNLKNLGKHDEGLQY